MKKHTEKLPIDDLFARKLGNMSMPPSADGFERLQRRMNQGEAEPRLVFWRNPQVQRYMAVAACLLLVCLFGWLYQTDSEKLSGGQQVATSQSGKGPHVTVPRTPDKAPETGNESANNTESVEPYVVIPPSAGNVSTNDNVAIAPKSGKNGAFTSKSLPAPKGQLRPEMTPVAPDAVAQVKPVIRSENISTPQTNATSVMPAPTTEQVAANQPKPAPSAERVLDVTIAEPEALVAARQVAKESADAKSAVAANAKTEKESKAGNLWQQVQRVRSGDVFARHDYSDDERGLLGRAYAGLKQSIEKDKSTKQ